MHIDSHTQNASINLTTDYRYNIISIFIDIIVIFMRPPCCTDIHSTKELTETIEFLKVISDDNRLRILCLLKDGEKCVCDIWQYLDIAQNLTSHHLKVLKNAQLIRSRKDGVKIFYALETKEISRYKKILQSILNFK